MIEIASWYLALGAVLTIYEFTFYAVSPILRGMKAYTLPLLLMVLRTLGWPYYAYHFVKEHLWP